MTEGIQFHLLGPPYVAWHGSILDIPRRQVRSLLYHLATYPSAIPQERLHYLLWEDKPEETCRRNLSQLFSQVRKLLPDKETLIVKKSLVMLDHRKLWCDVTEFRELTKNAKGEDHYLTLQQAAKLYRGPYLDGVSLPGGREFEYVVERERFSLERNHLSLLYKLILLEKNLKDYDAAIEYAYQYLAIDNLSEDVHRQLIHLFGLTGKRERAVEQYKLCENLLERELQTKPSKKTQATLQSILLEKTPNKDAPLIEKKPNIRPVKNNPAFVRPEYLSRLDALVNGGEYGPWGIVLLSGELGIGKSSLLEKYLGNLKREKLCLYAKCNPGMRSIPYWPIRQICLSAAEAAQRISSSRFNFHEEVEECLVHLSTKPDDLESPSNLPTNEDNLSRLVKTIYRLADMAEGLILCIEDLEWADQNTLDLISYLSTYLLERKILILGSYCCEENAYFSKFIHHIQVTDDYLGAMEVDGVDLETTLSIMKYWMGDFDRSEWVAKNLLHLSAGNPLFITEMLRWAAESDQSIFDIVNDLSISLPSSISKIIGFRLSLLNKTERKVINAIAVKGYLSGLDQIVDQTELSYQQVLDAVDKLVNHHFLEIRSTTYQFKHEIVRQSVLDAISPVRRQYLEAGSLTKE